MPEWTARAAGPPEGLGRKRRLCASSLFTETFRQGLRYVGRTMVLWIRHGPDASLRLGVVSSRKVGGAVARNLARRRLREIVRRNMVGLRTDVDIILVARRDAVSAPFQEVKADWLRLIERAGLHTKPKPSEKANGSGTD